MEAILEAFSNPTNLPIFVYLNQSKIFQSSISTLPPFCALMLNGQDTAMLCTEDGIRRAEGEEPEFAEGTQYCHAGRVNGRRQLDTGCVGVLSILYGAKNSNDDVAIERRHALIRNIRRQSPASADSLIAASEIDVCYGLIDAPDAALMDAILSILNSLLRATVDIHSLTINLAHELRLIMLGMSMLSTAFERKFEQIKDLRSLQQSVEELHEIQSHMDVTFSSDESGAASP